MEEREVSKVCTHARTGAGLSCVMAQSFKMGLTKDQVRKTPPEWKDCVGGQVGKERCSTV